MTDDRKPSIANSQGVQVGDHTIQYNQYGISPEQYDAKAEELGVAKSALQTFFAILEHENIPPYEWDHKLRQIAARFHELQKAASRLEGEDPAVEKLVEQARAAIDKAQFINAEALLAQAVAVDNAQAEKIRHAFSQRKQSAAASQALIAQSNHTRFALDQAIENYQKAIHYASEAQDEKLQAEYRWGLARVYDDTANYAKTIELYELALAFYSGKDEFKTDVASIWNNLGAAWANKGEYDKAIGYFEQALAVFSNKLGPDHPSTKTVQASLDQVRAKAKAAALTG